MDRLMGDLLARVPPDGTPWPRPARERWLAALAAVVELIYEDAAPASAAAQVQRAPSPFVDGPRPTVEDEPDKLPVQRPLGESPSVLDLRAETLDVTPRLGKHARPVSALA